MIRVTTRSRIQIASPDQGWSLTPGANHFESTMPDAVATQLEKLQAGGFVTIEIIVDGTLTPWTHEAAS